MVRDQLQARKRFAALLDQVTVTREPVLIRRRGKEAVALVAADELAGWMDRDGASLAFAEERTATARSGRAHLRRRGEAMAVDELRQRLELSRPGSV